MWTPKLSQELIDAAHGRFPGGDKKKDRPKSIRVFQNDILENYFAKAHWITPGIWFGPLVFYGAYRAVATPSLSAPVGAALLFVGLLVWTLSEYLLHRFVFHSLKYTDGQESNYLVHGYHHDFPDDNMRLVMVPIGSWPLGVLWGLLYYYALGPVYCWPVLGGTALGYISYDWIHYYTHHAKPTTAVGKWLRRYHLQHHHDDENSRYGVSSPLWDLVFGTYSPLKTARATEAPKA